MGYEGEIHFCRPRLPLSPSGRFDQQKKKVPLTCGNWICPGLGAPGEGCTPSGGKRTGRFRDVRMAGKGPVPRPPVNHNQDPFGVRPARKATAPHPGEIRAGRSRDPERRSRSGQGATTTVTDDVDGRPRTGRSLE